MRHRQSSPTQRLNSQDSHVLGSFADTMGFFVDIMFSFAERQGSCEDIQTIWRALLRGNKTVLQIFRAFPGDIERYTGLFQEKKDFIDFPVVLWGRKAPMKRSPHSRSPQTPNLSYVRIYVCMYVCTHMYVYMYVYMYIYEMSQWQVGFTYVATILIYIYMYVCMYVCMNIYIYIYIYIYIQRCIPSRNVSSSNA